MAHLLETFSKHQKTLAEFPRVWDRAKYVYGRILRRTPWPLPGRHAVTQVRLRGQRDPFHLRISSTDWMVLEEIFHNDEYAFVREKLQNPGWIVDLGANAGYSLRYWHSLFPTARVIAMEPEPKNCDICAKNISSGGLDGQVKLLRAAVGTRRMQMQLVDVGEGEWAYRTALGSGKAGFSVDVLPLSEVLNTHANGQTIDLLKCDIEGAEKDLFAECAAWIGQVHAIVVELHPPYGLADLQSDLKNAGADFEVVAHIQRKLCPVVMLRRRA